MYDFLQLLKEYKFNFIDFFDVYFEFQNLPDEEKCEIILEYHNQISD